MSLCELFVVAAETDRHSVTARCEFCCRSGLWALVFLVNLFCERSLYVHCIEFSFINMNTSEPATTQRATVLDT